MGRMAESTQWRSHVEFFIALTSLLQFSVANYNAALNQPVSVHPADASCGLLQDERLTYSNGDSVMCSSGCRRNVSTYANIWRPFPDDVIQMGGEHCHIAETNRDQLKSSMCWLTPSWTTTFTYSVWFKPTETQRKQ